MPLAPPKGGLRQRKIWVDHVIKQKYTQTKVHRWF